jgi:DNA-binding FrmR family transcriptional regulator
MSHTVHQKTKLGQRVARIRGQVDAIARALDDEKDCSEVMRLIASARGAMNGLMAEVLEDHIREHAFAESAERGSRDRAAEELIDVVRSYLR